MSKNLPQNTFYLYIKMPATIARKAIIMPRANANKVPKTAVAELLLLTVSTTRRNRENMLVTLKTQLALFKSGNQRI